MKFLRLVVGSVVLGCALLATQPAHAQRGRRRPTAPTTAAPAATPTPPSETDEQARIHFEVGRRFFGEADFERALVEFQQAYELSHRPQLLYNIGGTLERLARYSEAADTFEQLLAASSTMTAEERTNYERRIAGLRRRATEGAAPSVTPAETQTASTSDPHQTPTTTGSGDSSLTTVGLILGGVGVAGIATFAIFGGLALDRYESLEGQCATNSAGCTAGSISDLRTFSAVADIGLAVGVVGLVGGAVLYIVGSSSSSSTTSAALRLTPTGLSVSGTF